MIKIYDVAIIGMGAAGCMAGIAASQSGVDVVIADGNEKPGKKIYITGKGRCNVTNKAPLPEFLKHVCRNPRFLYSAFASFSNEETIRFFETHGQPLKVERGGRVFPTSDHSSDIIRVLRQSLEQHRVELRYHFRVDSIQVEKEHFILFSEDKQQRLEARNLIVATGGLSYPGTGSTGDGYRFAKQFGHSLSPTSPSLVPIQLQENFIADWEGISLRNIALSTGTSKKKKTYFGEMVFTRDGISGPIVLTLSSDLSGTEVKGQKLTLDWKPALTEEQLRRRLTRERDSGANRHLGTLFSTFLPQRVISVFLEKGGWKSDFPFHDWTRSDANRFIDLLKRFPLTVESLGSFKQAVITRGGVNVREVDPHTMQSRIQQHLFFAGEILDVDAQTGGYNLQLAFSTGHLAGLSAAALCADAHAKPLNR